MAEALSFNKIPFVNFGFCCHCCCSNFRITFSNYAFNSVNCTIDDKICSTIFAKTSKKRKL